MRILASALRIGLILWLSIGWRSLVSGQGRLLDPPGRSSMWRVGFETPINQNDNSLSCGGLQKRWVEHRGKCGVCGDPWDLNPRPNEAGGKYATGLISSVYTPGSVIPVTINIAVANGGYFEFRLCKNNNIQKPITETCLERGLLNLQDGTTRFGNVTDGENVVNVKLPDNVECDQCVMQWKYRTADHFGCDVDKLTKEETCGFGRGLIQTEYFACADIAIYKDKYAVTNKMNDVQQLKTFSVVPGTEGGNMSQSARKKRFAHFGEHVHRLPYFSLSGMSDRRFDPTFVPIMQQRRGQLRWVEPTGSRTSSRMRRRAHSFRQPRRSRFLSSQSRRFRTNQVSSGSNNFNVGRGEFFPGRKPVTSLMQVQQPSVQQILRPDDGVAVGIPSSSLFSPHLTIQTVDHVVKSTHSVPVKQCNACPFDQCLDKPFEMDKLFPGLFQDPVKFLECVKYEKLFNLKKYKVVSDGLPDCTHPRFRRQLIPTMPFEDDDVGCCATQPQVIMPLTVEADNDTFNVVQLPSKRNQFLVQGLCGRNRTVSCNNCEAENNFQWVLVYDPKANSNPPVAFVPVKFRHYCRCVNRGRSFMTG